MSTYVNFSIQVKKPGSDIWVPAFKEFYRQGITCGIFQDSSFNSFPVSMKGFPEGFQKEDKNIWGQTWYSMSEIETMVEFAKKEVLKYFKEVQENNTYTLFQGLINKTSFEDIKYSLKSIGEDEEDDYQVKEYEAIKEIYSLMEFAQEQEEADEVRLIVWFD